jgi:hypothetical protein
MEPDPPAGMPPKYICLDDTREFLIHAWAAAGDVYLRVTVSNEVQQIYLYQYQDYKLYLYPWHLCKLGLTHHNLKSC